MSCPTCDHTMQLFAQESNGLRVYWCPRCGTIRNVALSGHTNDNTPKLVERCRRLNKVVQEGGPFGTPGVAAEVVRLGILEAIHLPEERAG